MKAVSMKVVASAAGQPKAKAPAASAPLKKCAPGCKNRLPARRLSPRPLAPAPPRPPDAPPPGLRLRLPMRLLRGRKALRSVASQGFTLSYPPVSRTLRAR